MEATVGGMHSRGMQWIAVDRETRSGQIFKSVNSVETQTEPNTFGGKVNKLCLD